MMVFFLPDPLKNPIKNPVTDGMGPDLVPQAVARIQGRYDVDTVCFRYFSGCQSRLDRCRQAAAAKLQGY